LEKVVALTLEFAKQRTQAHSGWIGLGTDDGMRVVAGTAAGLARWCPSITPSSSACWRRASLSG
jgi:hypothetical protein